jgi:monofunctional biosynthetic peptidoglycan transglycosylase
MVLFLLLLSPYSPYEMVDISPDNPLTYPEAQQHSGKIRLYLRRVILTAKWGIIGFFATTLLMVVVSSFLNPPVTPLMVKRFFEQRKEGRKGVIIKKWVPFERISPNLVKAVVASEDNRFPEHWGIDMDAIQKAVDYNKKHRRKHGASTITQQTAKNMFLWPSRTWLRKGFELYFTVLIELVWSKKRIMEVYLNIIETGDGLYGAEAASWKYFHKPASRLTNGEAAMIAISLPDPRRRNPASPTTYMIRRQTSILNLMNKIGEVKF